MKPLFTTPALLGIAVLTAAASVNVALADNDRMIEVTITNISNNVTFTPIMAASHRHEIDLFEVGEAASDELITVAESGNVAPLSALLSGNNDVSDVQNSGGLLGPGQSVTIMLEADKRTNRVSIASMMLPTNDSFIALDSVRVPKRGKTASYRSPGYDAGSETNDEICLNIPGPYCGGAGLSPADPGEGYVHISRGIAGNADLAPADFDWRNDVAKITVRSVK